jgi:hypothetical protein
MEFSFWFWNSLCPAPSIADSAGQKRADCLSEASFRVLRPCQGRAGKSGDTNQKRDGKT